jgi:hypothetical protein
MSSFLHKFQISVPKPVRAPGELPEGLDKTFRFPENFVKETGLYFKEVNAVLSRSGVLAVIGGPDARKDREGIIMLRVLLQAASPGGTTR